MNFVALCPGGLNDTLTFVDKPLISLVKVLIDFEDMRPPMAPTPNSFSQRYAPCSPPDICGGGGLSVRIYLIRRYGKVFPAGTLFAGNGREEGGRESGDRLFGDPRGGGIAERQFRAQSVAAS